MKTCLPAEICLHYKIPLIYRYSCVSAQGWIANVRGGSFSSQGNHIKSSCSLVAFNTDQAGMNIWAPLTAFTPQRSSLFCVCNRVCCVSGGGGMVGLSSVNAASDGKWTVTQISCHAGEILTITGLINTLGSFGANKSSVPLRQANVTDSQFTINKPECLRPIWACPNSLSLPVPDLVTDLDFSPFDDYLLATCSADETVSHHKPCVCMYVFIMYLLNVIYFCFIYLF